MIEFLAFGWKIAILYIGIFIYFFMLMMMYLSIINDNSIIDKIFHKAFILLNLILIAFPIFSFIQNSSNSEFPPYLFYIDNFTIIWDGLILHWQWLIVIMLVPILCRKGFFLYFEVTVDLKVNRLKSEISRWLGTPYISPMMSFYILNPPPDSTLSEKFDKTNRLYSLAIDTLRENIYTKFEIKNKKPVENPVYWFRIIPVNIWYKLCINIAIFTGLSYYLLNNNPSNPFEDGFKYSIPILCGLIARIFGIGLSILNHATWGGTQRLIKNKYGAKDPLFPYTDFFGDQPMAEQVIDVWQSVYDDKKRKATGYNPVIPMPELPYAAKEIPFWGDEQRDKVNRFINKKSKQDTITGVKQQQKSNVVQFKK
jgi:hypothetical protein